MGIFKKRNIVSVEIIGANTTTKKSTTSSITRGLIGGAMLGGVGAIIGASTGKQKEQNNVTFLVTYDDGTTDTVTDKEGGILWDMYMRKMKDLQKNR